ncbi:hypothetical protein ACF0H5_019137 [Mactra antiquata]
MDDKIPKTNLLAQLRWYDDVNQHRNRFYERATSVKARIQHIMLTFLFVYTLCYLLLMNGIYITNLTHKTSINIQVHQSNSQGLKVYERIADDFLHNKSEHEAASEETDDAHDNLQGKTNSNKENTTSKNKGNKQHQAKDKPKSNKDKKEALKKRMYNYGYEIVHRITGRHSFFITAILDPVSDTSLNGADNREEAWNKDVNDDSTTTGNGLEPGDVAPGNKDPFEDYLGVDEMFKSKNIENYWVDESGRDNTGIIVVNGWEYFVHLRNQYDCCYQYNNTDVKSTRLIKKITWNVNDLKIVKATQFVCPLLLHTSDGVEDMLPTKIALATLNGCQAPNVASKYVNVEQMFPIADKISIGVCAKLIYKNFSAEKLIEWVEFNKMMGVNKMMLFTHDISPDTKFVLDYYVKQGLMFLKEFDYPLKLVYPRMPGGKNVMSFQDEQVTVFDCMERFNNYDFVAVIDLDEFLVPTRNNTWRTMLTDLMKEYPTASGFSFHTQIFTLDWGVSNPNGEFFVTRYVKRTRTMWDRKKNIILPSRILRGSAWTHEFTSLNGHTAVKVPSKTANIFHYRKCRPHWVMFGTCTSKRRKVPDDTMISVMDRIKTQVIDMKRLLLK